MRRVEGDDEDKYCFVAKNNVSPGQELTFDYGLGE